MLRMIRKLPNIYVIGVDFMEKWKDIPGYEGLYQISSCGRVKSLNYRQTGKEKILKQITVNGYKLVNFCNNGKVKQYQVHRLVAQAFIPNPNNYPIINHIDEQPYNNFKENLEWCTYEYNNSYGTKPERIGKARKGKHHTEETKSKISKAMVGKNHPKSRKVQASTGEMFDTVREAATWCSSYSANITNCCIGKLKHTGKHPVTKEPLQWKYI